ncbi:MAG: flagellar basal body P-ring protein FlgI [bacterium]
MMLIFYKKMSLLFVSLILSSVCFGQSRIKDIANFQGMHDHHLIGYGLVIGLDGTGDRSSGASGAIFTVQSIANMLEKFGITVPGDKLRVRNVAAVMVTSKLEPFTNIGTKIDVTVSSIGDSKSLEGGILLETPLFGNDSQLYALAQGPVSIGGFNIETDDGEKIRRNYALVGRVPNGAILQNVRPFQFDTSTPLGILLRKPDFTTAARVAELINDHFGRNLAAPTDAATISVEWPSSLQGKGDLVRFIADVETLRVRLDRIARVVINERTGTIVAGGDVQIADIMVSHGNLTIHTRRTPIISQPSPFARRGKTVVEGVSQTTIEAEDARTVVLKNTVSVSDISSALNQLGVKPRDIIAIFQAIKEAGALQAELIIM